jgi:ribosomal protein S24E
MVVSIYKDAYSTSPVNSEYTDILTYIQNGRWKDQVERLRLLPEESYKKEKLSLPAVSFGGVFSQRNNKGLIQYSSLLLIDIDNLTKEEVVKYKDQLSQDTVIHCVFISPSEKGLKLLFRVNEKDPKYHVAYFKSAQKHLEETYALTVDKSGKDISRLCFVSYDPFLHFNPDSEFLRLDAMADVFPKAHYAPVRTLVNMRETVDPQKALEICCGWVEKSGKAYVEGQRNHFLHSVACAMNRVGVMMDDTIDLMMSNFDLAEEEIRHLCRMAYFHNRQEFGVYPLAPEKFTDSPQYIEFTGAGSEIKEDIANMIMSVMTGTKNMALINRISGFYIDGLISHQYADFTNEEKVSIIKEVYDIVKSKKTEVDTQNSLIYESFEEIATIYADSVSRDNKMKMYIDYFDQFNILSPGLFIEVIGLPKTFKSVLVSHIARSNAKGGVPTLMVHGEMSKAQTFERNSISELDIDWKSQKFSERKFDKDYVIGIGETLQAIFKGNLFNVHMRDFTKESICATISKIEATTGKKIELIIIDGITEFDWRGRDEIQAAIYNSMEAKELAKITNACVLGLLHTAGRPDKHYRNTADFARGGNKVIGQADAMLMTSLIVHPDTNLSNNDDIIYIQDIFYLRYEDKRGANGILNCVVNVDPRMRISYRDHHVSQYEIKIDKK